jgi:protein O-GlcNAc transferase
MAADNPKSLAMNVDQALNLGIRHYQAGKLTEAEAIYRKILATQPDHADALNLLGVIESQNSRQQAALELISQAIAINPKSARYQNNLGLVLVKLGRLQDGVAAYRTALKLNPNDADTHYNLGAALQNLDRMDEAMAEWRAAIALKFDHARAHCNLGAALLHQRRTDEAIAALQSALKFNPDYPEAYYNLGVVYKDIGQLNAAMEAFGAALRLRPDYPEAQNNLGNALKDQGQLNDAIAAYRTALRLKPDYFAAYSNLLYSLYYHPGYDAGAIHKEHIQWNQRQTELLKKIFGPHTNNRDPERRLKIGYVSPDFCGHAESYFVVPLLESHDHRQFEIHCYADVRRPDRITDRIRLSVNVWHDVLGKSNADLAQQIREDQIDILVDLTMHMAHNRLLVFARKPAPIQVTWLAYPGTTGLETIDYRISDAFMDPPDNATSHYSEETIRLPDCWCCFDPLSDLASRPPRQDGPICFGSLNNPCKLNEPILRLWGRALLATPGSQIMILAPSMDQRNRIRLLYEQMDIDTARLIFVERTPRPEYLRSYDRIDIGLDPLPYNGITTTLDALWMGVPMVSLAGSTAAGRAGLGILSTLGLPELATHNPEQFVQTASALAVDLAKLTELRKTLRQRMQASPLMDAKRFAQNIELAYRDMWRKLCSSAAGPRREIR